MKRNLVIGSDGFIGTPFCRFLEAKGEEVVRFDIKRGPKEDARTETLPLKGIDIVYFLAWDVGGSKYLYEPKRQKNQLDWNLQLMKNVFDQLEKSHTKFLFVSSQLCEEADTVYGATKRLGEVWTQLLGGACVRVWNAYGFMEEANIKSHVLSDFIYQALKTKKITMMTNGEEWRQFTHIQDLSNAFHMAANSANRRRTVYDASSYEWVRIIDVAHMIADLTGAKVFPGATKGHDPVPAQNMGRVPGWLPTVELQSGIRAMVEEAQRIVSHERHT
jgi:nucleoside-diphosphate-sugar epimerase